MAAVLCVQGLQVGENGFPQVLQEAITPQWGEVLRLTEAGTGFVRQQSF